MKKEEKEKYKALKLTCIFLHADIVRTSYGNDGNTDDNWEDDNTSAVLMG